MTIEEAMAQREAQREAEHKARMESARANVHIRQRPRRSRGSQFYLDRSPSGAEKTMCGAAPDIADMSWAETRHQKNRAYVTCADCLARRPQA